MRIYIAGLIANGGELQPHQVAENCARFDDAEAWLYSLGHKPINPIKLHDTHPTKLSRITLGVSQYRLRHDVGIVSTCDAIYMLVGWERSQGAFLEFTVARGLGLEIFFQTNPNGDCVPDLGSI